jgi:hypothetical protein
LSRWCSPTITAIQTDVAALQSTSGTVAAAGESFYPNTVTQAVFTGASTDVNPPATQTAFTITVAARYSRQINVSIPLVISRDWFNIEAGPGAVNTWQARVTGALFEVTKDGLGDWATGTCGSTDSLPRQVTVSKGVSQVTTSVQIYMTNLTLDFLPDDSGTSHEYIVRLTPMFTSTISGADGSTTTAEGFLLNSSISGFRASTGGTIASGSVGANFSSQVYTTTENIIYPSTSVAQLKADTVIHNAVYTRSVVTGGLDVAQRAQLNNGFDCQGNALFSQGIRCTAGTDSTEYSASSETTGRVSCVFTWAGTRGNHSSVRIVNLKTLCGNSLGFDCPCTGWTVTSGPLALTGERRSLIVTASLLSRIR